METKHTPGPWKTFSPNGLLNIPIGTYKITVAFTSIDLEKRGLSEANAKLIAAAPDLLKL